MAAAHSLFCVMFLLGNLVVTTSGLTNGNPCEYCKFCKFCDDCNKCPCKFPDEYSNCHACGYCDYCPLCTACSVCDSDMGGYLIESLSSTASSWMDTISKYAGESTLGDSTIGMVKKALETFTSLDEDKIKGDLKKVDQEALEEHTPGSINPKEESGVTVTVIGDAMALDASSFQAEVTDGNRNAFVMFFAPWCGHCKKLKPDWSALATKFKDHEKVLIATVDCTTENGLCDAAGIKGFPTLKYYVAGEGSDYEKPRSLTDMKGFVETHLNFQPCDSNHQSACSEEELVLLKEAMALSEEERKTKMEQIEKEIYDAQFKESRFKKEVRRRKKEAKAAHEQAINAMKKTVKLIESVKGFD